MIELEKYFEEKIINLNTGDINLKKEVLEDIIEKFEENANFEGISDIESHIRETALRINNQPEDFINSEN
jgi:hypothetical protein